MSPRVRFDDEADAEYRFAGRWYEARREHLGIEFFDAVDATIDQIVAWKWRPIFGSSPLRTTGGNRAIGETA